MTFGSSRAEIDNSMPEVQNGNGMEKNLPKIWEREGNNKNIPRIQEWEGNEKIYSHNSGTGRGMEKSIPTLYRVEICRDHHDRRLCKICANCVEFP